MPEFAYSARNLSGEDIQGTIKAASHREALAVLAERSLFPLQVKSRSPGVRQWLPARRVKPAIIATSLSQMADLLQNGVALMPALELLAEQSPHPELQRVFGELQAQVAEGTPLDAAMARFPHVFNELMVSMVRAGSEGAFLEEALQRTADFLELQEDLRSRVVGAMTYPAILAVAGSAIVAMMIIFFVPRFADLFARLEQQGGLPGPTIALLALSDFLGRFGIFVAIALLASLMGMQKWSRTPAGRAWIDRCKLTIPVAGEIFLLSAVSRFTRVLGTLLRNGVPLLRSLDISSDSAGNVLLGNTIRAAAETVSSGQSLSKPLAECGLIPRSVMAMISTAEESNSLDRVLVNIADGIDRRIARKLDLMVRLLEPLILMVLGGVILFVLAGLLLPVFDMSAAL